MSNNKNCIFCDIGNNKISAFKIYEDADFFAILDIFPIEKYHILLIPKHHYKHFNQMPNELICKSVEVLKKIMQKIEVQFGVTDFNVTTNIGPKSGQEILHMHWHIIPHMIQRTSHKLTPRISISKEELKSQQEILKIN